MHCDPHSKWNVNIHFHCRELLIYIFFAVCVYTYIYILRNIIIWYMSILSILSMRVSLYIICFWGFFRRFSGVKFCPPPPKKKKALKGLRKNLPWSPLIYSAFQNSTITRYIHIYIYIYILQCASPSAKLVYNSINYHQLRKINHKPMLVQTQLTNSGTTWHFSKSPWYIPFPCRIPGA